MATHSSHSLSAMEQLYAAFYQRLYLYALTFLNDDDEARDVVSDVFTAVWNGCNRQADDAVPTSAFLYNLTRNRCIDLLRRDKARQNYAEFIRHMETESFVADDHAHYEERITQLRQAIDRLPEPERAILECCYFQRLTYKQAAEQLQLTLVVIKKNMLKVFKKLRKELNKL